MSDPDPEPDPSSGSGADQRAEPDADTSAEEPDSPAEPSSPVDASAGGGEEAQGGDPAASASDAETSSTTELRSRIEAVRRAEADAEVLVSLAVAPDEDLTAVRRRIEKDHTEADRGDGGDRRLTDALDRTKRVLQDYDSVPEHGLVAYVGAVDSDAVEYVFDALPSPISDTLYVHDNGFTVAPLDALVGSDTTVGLVVVERGGAALGRYEGGTVETLATFDSNVPGKTKAGGQSAERFERRREERKAEFFEDVTAEAERLFAGGSEANESAADGSTDGDSWVDGVVGGGTTVTADRFADDERLPPALADLLLGEPVAVEYANERGLTELAEKAEERIEAVDRRPAADALEEFFGALAAGDDAVVYGPEETNDALEFEAVGTLLVGDSLPVETVREYEERAEGIGAEVVLVPTDSEDGERFAEAFGGVGALLRFPIE